MKATVQKILDKTIRVIINNGDKVVVNGKEYTNTLGGIVAYMPQVIECKVGDVLDLTGNKVVDWKTVTLDDGSEATLKRVVAI